MGTFAVQIAKHFGAEVTAVDSAKKFDMLRSIGAEQVIDYTKEDFTEQSMRYDLVFDAVGKMISGLSKSQCERVLNPGGVFVSIEMNYKESAADLDFLTNLIEAGEIKPVIDRRYALEDMVEAHRYVERGHKKGNVVIAISHEDD